MLPEAEEAARNAQNATIPRASGRSVKRTLKSGQEYAQQPIADVARKGGVNMTTVNCRSICGQSGPIFQRIAATCVPQPVVDGRDSVGVRACLERVDFSRVEPRQLQPRETEEGEEQEELGGEGQHGSHASELHAWTGRTPTIEPLMAELSCPGMMQAMLHKESARVSTSRSPEGQPALPYCAHQEH